MGIMDKVKNLFTEEVEDDRPIKKEVRHVEIPSPKLEESKPKVVEEKEEIISDTPVIKKEEKFVFPVYFDDKDFDDLEKPKKVEKKEIKKEKPKRSERVEKELYNGSKDEVKEVSKNFRPSLIISPVYGVLDKNYHKEDITTKKVSNEDIYYHKSDKVTVDDIRQKAYGTLEEEIKNNVLGHEDLLKEKEENTETAIDLFSELDFDEIDKENNSSKNENNNNDLIFDNEDLDDDTAVLAQQLEEQKKKLNEINNYIEENTVEKKPKDLENEKEIDEFIEETNEELIEEDEGLIQDKLEEELEVEEETEETQNPDLTESELFNLIDSMYDDKEEK